MIPASPLSYTCWRCLARGRIRLTSPPSLRRVGAGAGASIPTSQSLLTQSRRHYAAKHGKERNRHGDPEAMSFDPSVHSEVILAIRREAGVPDGENLKFRDLLKKWEATRPAPGLVQLMPDGNPNSKVANLHNRTGAPDACELRQPQADPGPDHETQGGGHVVGPGDLVEIRTPSSRLPVLAIYLGFFGKNYHFYASTGKWHFLPTYVSYFSVPKFVDEAAIAPIVAHIPQTGSSETYLDMEQSRLGPSRADASAALDCMAEFLAEAERVYQAKISVLGNSHRAVAGPQNFRFITLAEIAHLTLPNSDEELSDTTLYAVHLALMRVDGGVRPLQPQSSDGRRDFLFEIAPLPHLEIIRSVQTLTRKLVFTITANADHDITGDVAERVLMKNIVYQFLSKARLAVQASRAHRQPTRHAMVGVFQNGPDSANDDHAKMPEWTAPEKEIIKFFEMWAVDGNFGAGSSLHSAGSLLLRILGCYPDIEFLSNSVAWLFLQEIGWMPPWELPARYRVKLPEISVEAGGALVRHAPDGLDNWLRDDIANGHRRDWGSTSILCIDSLDTSLVDDGMSLERTDADDEFWIHVHIADPTSGINPKSDLVGYMELMPENIWLEGHFANMLPQPPEGASAPLLSKKYSLAAGAPCLTFSTKVNMEGDVLDSRIEPGILNNVIYLDTEQVTDLFGKRALAPHAPLAVGTAPAPAEAARNVTAISALSAKDRADLKTLNDLATILHKKKAGHGALPFDLARPRIKISLESVSKNETTNKWEGDPYIKLDWDTNCSLLVVSMNMQLAGETAAKWCNKRGIPIPYRRDSKGDDLDQKRASDFYLGEIHPRSNAGLPLEEWQLRTMAELVGRATNSLKPGPAFRMGLEMYSRVTSPLRRLTDMLTHWQVHAALALERRLGRPITSADIVDPPATVPPSPSSANLAFSSVELERMLHGLTLRSRMIKYLNMASDEWALQALVRAWRFGQAPLPPSFKFTITGVGRRVLVGELCWFKRRAAMKVEHLGNVVRVNDVREGDQFEVELEDVNVHTRVIHVKALKKIFAEADTSDTSDA